MSAAVRPPYPYTAQRTKAHVGVFGELWLHTVALSVVGAAMLGGLLMIWGAVSSPGGLRADTFAALLVVVIVAGVLGLVFGVVVGIPVAAVGYFVLRRHPSAWVAMRFARCVGVVAAVLVTLVFGGMGSDISPAFLVASLAVGQLLAPRLVDWYIDRLDRGRR